MTAHSRTTPPAIVRANNPCALRPLSTGRWKGQSGTITTPGGQYCAFSEPVWGVRAGLRNLNTYRRRHGLNTPATIIARWAPRSDNNPESAYARFIARRMGIRLLRPIPHDYEHNRRLITAIIRFECGYPAVSADTVAQALALMAEEERSAGRDPSPYLADPSALKPLSRSREIAIGGGAATAGIGGAVAYGPDAIDIARDAVTTGRDAVAGVAEAIPPQSLDYPGLACIGSFLLLAISGLAIVSNRLWARYRAYR